MTKFLISESLFPGNHAGACSNNYDFKGGTIMGDRLLSGDSCMEGGFTKLVEPIKLSGKTGKCIGAGAAAS